MNAFILLGLAIFAEVAATNLLKISNGFTRFVPTSLALALYGVAFYLLSVIFKTLPLGIVYAIWSGVGIVLTSIVAYFVFDQKIDLGGIIGIFFIILGVVVINFFSNSLH